MIFINDFDTYTKYRAISLMEPIFSKDRRDLAAKTLMSAFLILFTMGIGSDLFAQKPTFTRIVLINLLVILFAVGWLTCPTNPNRKG